MSKVAVPSPNQISRQSGKDAVSEATVDLFLGWAKTRSDLFEAPTIRILNFGDQTIFRSTVKIRDAIFKLPVTLFGTGRAETVSLSLLKAYAEALERAAMVMFHREKLIGQWIRVNPQNLSVSDVQSSHRVHRPPAELITSNGWAAHFSEEQALQNSVFEAVERHILQYSFLKSGWSGLPLANHLRFGDFRMTAHLAQHSFWGISAGLIRAKSNTHSGFTCGYMSENLGNLDQTPQWTHAVLESIEPLYFFDRMSKSSIMEIAEESCDFLERNQLRILTDPMGKLEFEAGECLVEEVAFPDVPIWSFLADLQTAFELPFRFHTSFVFSEGLLPLFSTGLKTQDAAAWVKRAFTLNELDPRKMNEITPVY